MNELIQEMIDWVEAQMMNSFSLKDLSHAMGYSPYYCSFKFHQITGMSLKRYVLLRKMYLAATTLVDTNERIIEVAIGIGYTSQAAFTRAFKQVFGVNPKEFRLNPEPLQTFAALTLESVKDEYQMNGKQKLTIEAIQQQINTYYDRDVLNILNGEEMYQEFYAQKLMGESDYVPFNEAMAVHETTELIFDEAYKKVRAAGHQVSIAQYEKVTIKRLEKLFTKKYKCIVLWFGEDMFCQMNLLTILAYLEQRQFEGTVYYHAVREQTYGITEMKIELGSYRELYQKILCQHQKPTTPMLPVMHQGVNWYFALLEADNEIVRYIQKNKQKTTEELVKNLLQLFPQVGLGDTQYLEIIQNMRA